MACFQTVVYLFQESASVKVLAAISFCDIYTDRNHLDPERFQRAHRCISDKQFTDFVSDVFVKQPVSYIQYITW